MVFKDRTYRKHLEEMRKTLNSLTLNLTAAKNIHTDACFHLWLPFSISQHAFMFHKNRSGYGTWNILALSFTFIVLFATF